MNQIHVILPKLAVEAALNVGLHVAVHTRDLVGTHRQSADLGACRCLVPKRRLPNKQARPLGHRAKAGVVSVDSC